MVGKKIRKNPSTVSKWCSNVSHPASEILTREEQKRILSDVDSIRLGQRIVVEELVYEHWNKESKK